MADNQPAAFDLMVALDSVIQEARVGIEGQKMNLDNSSARLGAVMRRNVEQAGTYSEVLQKILIELDAKMEDDGEYSSELSSTSWPSLPLESDLSTFPPVERRSRACLPPNA